MLKKFFIINIFLSLGLTGLIYTTSQELFEIDQAPEIYPKSVSELVSIVNKSNELNKKISLVGANKSQGGQTANQGAKNYRINLAKLNKLISLDRQKKIVTVQAGMTWKDLQKIIAPLGLSVKAMQSYNNFSIGGSVSVNVHGQDIVNNPLIKSIRSLKILMSDGEILNVGRTENSTLFNLVVGGYGLFGIIIEVSLDLTKDLLMERQTVVLKSSELVEYFNKNLRNDPSIQFYSARLSMDEKNFLDKVIVVSYKKTDKISDESQSYNQKISSIKNEWLNKCVKYGFALASNLKFMKQLRFPLECAYFKSNKIISRNDFMGFTLDGLPQDDSKQMYILQEYFIPYDNVNNFIKILKETTKKYDVNLLNITTRHVNADKESVLSYSPEESCAFVLYINVKKDISAYNQIINYTNKLIDSTISLNGKYYLPYQLLGSKEQLNAIYPKFKNFVKLKKKYDPQEIFVNNLYTKYA